MSVKITDRRDLDLILLGVRILNDSRIRAQGQDGAGHDFPLKFPVKEDFNTNIIEWFFPVL